MIRRFHCKRSHFVYVYLGASMLGSFIYFIIHRADSLDIEYIATHLFLLFTLYGLFLFPMLTLYRPRTLWIFLNNGTSLPFLSKEQAAFDAPAPMMTTCGSCNRLFFTCGNLYDFLDINISP